MKHQPQTLVLLMVMLSFTSLTAQKHFSNPGRVNIKAGIGLLPSYMKAKSVSNSIPVHLMIGYRVSKQFNFSAFAGYAAATTSPTTFSDGLSTYLENKSFALGLRGELRHEINPRWGVYGGSMIGYYAANIQEFMTGTRLPYERNPEAPTPYNPDESNVKLLYSAFIGTNYFIKKGLGVYAELGYGISLFNMGFSFRI